MRSLALRSAAGVLLAGLLVGAVGGAPPPPEAEPALYSYRVIARYPHDRHAFTQGLAWHDGVLYEGTGRYGASSLRQVELPSGRPLRVHKLPANLFGEGITIFDDKVIQLTWRSRLGFVYDAATFKLERTFSYDGEGWGLTHDGKRLIMSDGSSRLTFLDPLSLEPIGSVGVRDGGKRVTGLNELEYVEGEILGNVWQTDRIARIDPESGKVTGWIDLTGLLGPQAARDSVDVLNGIAYDAVTRRLFVTGKLWPALFEIELVPAS